MSGWAQPGRVARPGPGPWQDDDADVHDRGWQGGEERAAGGLAGAGATLSLQSAHPRPRALERLHRSAADAERSGPGVSGRPGAGSAADPWSLRLRPGSASARRGPGPARVVPRVRRAGELAARRGPPSPGGGRGTQRSGGRGDDAGARELLAANPPAASLLNSEG